MRPPVRATSAGATAEPVVRALVDVSADGLAVLDGNGRFTEVNAAGHRILGLGEKALHGHPSPFELGRSQPSSDIRRQTEWQGGDGRWQRLEYRVSALPDGRCVVWFTDVTETLREQERLSAITRAAASVADSGSLSATLEAVAREVWMTANISAVQIMTIDNPRDELRVVGMAGFGDTAGFTDRLSECRRLGADVRFIDALEQHQPVVVLHRKRVIMNDPRWIPLKQIMSEPDWDSFVSMPLVVRGRVLGVINAYYVPGDDPGPSSLAFLSAMADHAAVAIETASLLAQTRSRAQMEERRKLARDLHDSVVQQLFSMGMQARALRSSLDRTGGSGTDVRDGVEEMVGLARNALADLRGLVFELHPLDLADRGLVDAVRSYAAGVEARHDLVIDVRAAEDLELDLGIDVAEDLYRIVQEALHNVVKHARATRAGIDFGRSGRGGVTVRITDDGIGGEAPASGKSLGLVSMRERAERWRGGLAAGAQPGGGWAVEVALPAGPAC
ncbi:sensor histidine kinase [Saccharopolyspora mangrovi]|uniref:Histidine kinase n=1 Tax=Saccharopolyspora mangrovi TaxID=3082379 RepID=A0ABU6AC32_9PSEU|nr:histidine kinase [Saccharopolyspora sp. S2-29]MEB3369018.1 histidine kinase [Saccharopolyspora sp. S2-29]